MTDFQPPIGDEPPDDELQGDALRDEALLGDARRASALLERQGAFEMSPEQLARGKLALEAALDEHDLRAAHDSAMHRGKKGERGRLRRWLYTPVLPVLAGAFALALAMRFSREEAPAERAALSEKSPRADALAPHAEEQTALALPLPPRELVLAQTARLEARLARLEVPPPSQPAAPAPAARDMEAAGAAAPSEKAKAHVEAVKTASSSAHRAALADASVTEKAPLDPSAAERDFERAMQGYRARLLASLTEAP